uniref:RWD domain-containing protein n=1 Tax=Parastrongyloides trichosuri TaxID=131310 RepID=A0A0N4ZN68_PARTI
MSSSDEEIAIGTTMDVFIKRSKYKSYPASEIFDKKLPETDESKEIKRHLDDIKKVLEEEKINDWLYVNFDFVMNSS